MTWEDLSSYASGREFQLNSHYISGSCMYAQECPARRFFTTLRLSIGEEAITQAAELQPDIILIGTGPPPLKLNFIYTLVRRLFYW